MGYQESVLKVKKKYQDELVKQIIHSDSRKYFFCEPSLIVEVKKDIEEFDFKKGDKLIYICGERDGQENLEDFIENSEGQIKMDSNIEHEMYPVEDLQELSLFEILEYKMDNGYGEDEYFKVSELDKYIENQAEKNINKYEEVKNRHQARINAFPIEFAFNNEQFKNMMEKWELSENDFDKIIPINGGGFIRKTDKEKYTKMLEEQRKEHKDLIEQDKTGEGYIKDMFVYELNNHEYSYTYELDDTLNALGFSYSQVINTPNLKHGLELARKEILEKETEQDYEIE